MTSTFFDKEIADLLSSGYIRELFEQCDNKIIIGVSKEIFALSVDYLFEPKQYIYLLVNCSSPMSRNAWTLLKYYDLNTNLINNVSNEYYNTTGNKMKSRYPALLYVQNVKLSSKFIEKQTYHHNLPPNIMDISKHNVSDCLFGVGGQQTVYLYEDINSPTETYTFSHLMLLKYGYSFSIPSIHCISNLVYDNIFGFGLIAVGKGNSVQNMKLNDNLCWKQDIPPSKHKVDSTKKVLLSIITSPKMYLMVYDAMHIQLFDLKDKNWINIDLPKFISLNIQCTIYFDKMDQRLYFLNHAKDQNSCFLDVDKFKWIKISAQQTQKNTNKHRSSLSWNQTQKNVQRVGSKLFIISIESTQCFDIKKNIWIDTENEDIETLQSAIHPKQDEQENKNVSVHPLINRVINRNRTRESYTVIPES